MQKQFDEKLDCIEEMISQMQRAIPKDQQHLYGTFSKEIDELQNSLQNKVDELYKNILNNFNRTTLNNFNNKEGENINDCSQLVSKKIRTSKQSKENVFELVSRKMILNSTGYKNINEATINTDNILKISMRKRHTEEESKLRNLKPYLRRVSQNRITPFEKAQSQKYNNLVILKERNIADKSKKELQLLPVRFTIVDYKFEEKYQDIQEVCMVGIDQRRRFREIIKWVEEKCENQNIKRGTINSKKLLGLLVNCPLPLKSDFMNLFEDQEVGKDRKVIKSKNYDMNHKEKQIVKIENALKTFFNSRTYTLKLKQHDAVTKIQLFWRRKMNLEETRRTIKAKNLQIISQYKQIQSDFKRSWNSLKFQNRIELHIANWQLDEFQKLSMQNLKQIENTLITRIFRSKDSSVTIVYVSPVLISSQIAAYYRKVIEMTQFSECKFHFVTPEVQIQNTESLMTSLMNSPKCIGRIKDIFRNKIGYIVPGHSSMEYVKLAVNLGLPVYGAIQESRYFELTSSIPRLVTPSNTLPSCYDIYSMTDLYSSLSTLIYSHPNVVRWYLKIDDSRKGRGLAYIDTQTFSEFNRLQDKISDGYKDSVISYISIILQQKLKNKLKIVCNLVYKSYEQYMKKFLTKGGCIEASVNACRDSETSNISLMVQIDPSDQWKIIGSYEKITIKHRPIGYEFLQATPQILREISKQVVSNMIKKHRYFGFIVLDFVRRGQDQHFLIGVDSYLNQAISAFSMASLFTTPSEPLFVYCPIITQKGIRDLQFKTFFQFCRLEGISFDINQKSGSIFTFVDSLQSSCLGLISISSNRRELFRLILKTVEFISKNSKKQQQQLSVIRSNVDISLEDIYHKLRVIYKRMLPRENIINQNLLPL